VAAYEALNPVQFNAERSIMEQSNPQQDVQKVRGTQSMTSNVYRPAFSHDLSQVRGLRSPASAEPANAQSMEEEEDEE
jgi:hypothetical protein